MGKSHVASINLVPDLHHFLTLLEIPNKSHYRVSNEKPLINYNKSIMMTNEPYLPTLEQKLAKKEVIIQ